LAVGFSAFTTKPLFTSVYYYLDQPNSEVSISQTNSLVTANLNDATYWDPTNPFSNSQATGSYLFAIDFNESQTADASGQIGDDGSLTKQEAIDAVRTYFVNNSTLPTNGLSFTVGSNPGTPITIMRSATNSDQ
jgi:hypothetical protein